MNEITIGDKIYISAKRAAEITGYARDYVGQLCREGHIDAKMVGRSWYVYEPSIRAHRFGEVASQASSEPEIFETAPVSAPVSAPEPIAKLPDTWEKPVYKPETFDLIPELPAREEELALPEAEESLIDMQSAWKEWFARKQEVETRLEVPEIESPEVIDERNEAYENEDDAEPEVDEEEIAIPLHKIQEEPVYEAPIARYEEDAEPIAIHHIEEVPARREVSRTPVEAPVGRVLDERVVSVGKKRAYAPRRSYAPITATLIGLCLLVVGVTVIGTGSADRYMQTLIGKNAVINFLVGTSEFKR